MGTTPLACGKQQAHPCAEPRTPLCRPSQLSLSNPKQEMVAYKLGTGRHSAPPACGLQHAGAATGPSGRPFGSGGSLARTASMHGLQRLAA